MSSTTSTPAPSVAAPILADDPFGDAVLEDPLPFHERLREAGRLGFGTFLMPESASRQLTGKGAQGMQVVPVRTVADLAEQLFRS